MRSDKLAVPVWDLPTRITHWLLVSAVAVAWATAESPGVLFAVHKLAGYAIGAGLIFRLIWGFIGSPRSRFADFVRPWAAVREHAVGLLRLEPPRSVGHDPIGGWMIVALLGVLAVVVASGLFAASRELSGPYADVLPATLGRALAGVHGAAVDVLIVLAAIHAAGVLFTMALARENLVGAMWHGRKLLDAEAARAEPPLAPGWYAIPPAAVAVALMAWIAL